MAIKPLSPSDAAWPKLHAKNCYKCQEKDDYALGNIFNVLRGGAPS